MVVIESPTGDRAEVHPDALHDWTQRGFKALGPAAEGAPSLLTVPEWEAEMAARAAAVKAATTPNRKAKTTTPQEG